MPQFMLFIGAPEHNVLIAHNAAKFDIGFLAMACARSGLPMPDHRIVDSIDLCRQCMPKPHNLRSVCQRLGLATGAHRALGDAMAVMQVVLRLGSRHPGAWQNLPFYYAEDFGVEIIEPPSEFEEWEECDDPTQEVEFVYNRGSRPGEVRRAIPQSFFECDGNEHMVGFCMRDGKLKTFDTFFMSDITVPEDSVGAAMRRVTKAPAQKAVAETEDSNSPSPPVTYVRTKTPMTTEQSSALFTTFGVIVIVVAIGGIKLLIFAVRDYGVEGLVLFMAAVGLFWLFLFIIINPVNGLLDSFLGPHDR
jgi:hypothetical protein